MKKDTLRVGTSKGEFYVEVEIQSPETLADCATLSKQNEAYQVAKFARAHRIDLQEGGARETVVEMLGGKSPAAAMKDAAFMALVKAAVEAEIKSFDPAAPRARGGRKPAAPQVVTLKAGKKTFSEAEVKAMLAGLKGITVSEA